MQPPSWHRNNVYWSTRSPDTLFDRFAFSQPDVITCSKSVYPGRSGGQAAPTNNFSQFLFTSIPNNNSHSMKFKIPKVFSSSIPNHTNHTIKSIPSTLYDDPAFSPDPLSHPFFATSHDVAWASPPATMDRNTRSSLSLTSPALAVSIVNANKSSISIPPNNPMLPDKTTVTSTVYDGHSLSVTNPYESQPSMTPLSSAPSSADSHQPLDTAPKSVEAPRSIPQKKKNSITMFWRRPDDIEESMNLEQPGNKRQESPPSYDAIFSARPAHSRGLSVPETRQSVDRPSMPPRPVTTTVDVRPPPTASQRNIGGHPIRAHELDKIDELDESNPLGIPVHHGGPYEAIQKVVQSTTPHNIGNQYQDRSHKIMTSRGHPNYHTASGPPPIGVSLNLTPGQVLPRNFQEHYLPRQDFVGEPAAHSRPHESLPSQSRKVDRRNDQTFGDIALKWSNHHFSLPAGIPPAEDPQQWQKHSPPYEQSSFNSASFEQSGFGPAKTGTRTSVISNTQHPFEPQLQSHAQIQHRSLDHDLSHGRTHDIQQDERMTNRRSAGLPQRPSGFEPNVADATERNQPSYAFVPPDQGHGDPEHKFEPVGLEQPSRIPNTIHHTSVPNSKGAITNGKSSGSANDAPPQASQDRDVRSLKQTIVSASGSSRSQNGGRAPQPRHLPKRLVMPTPLQPSHLNAPQTEQALYPLYDQSPPNHAIQAQQYHSRPPSPPSIVRPIGAPRSDKRYTRAQEIPMSQSRKLKKRSILGVDGIPPPPAPHIALSFEPTITSIDPPHSIPPTRYKSDKAPKKVLSKRRVDL